MLVNCCFVAVTNKLVKKKKKKKNYATRHDTTACDTTGQRTKARRFFSWCHTYYDTTMRLD